MAETFHTALGVSVVLQLFIEPLCSVEMTAHTVADFAQLRQIHYSFLNRLIVSDYRPKVVIV
jgi:hypothetical protein